MSRPARLWRKAKCTERGCGKVEEGWTSSIFADVDDIELRDPKIGNIHTCKWCIQTDADTAWDYESDY